MKEEERRLCEEEQALQHQVVLNLSNLTRVPVMVRRGKGSRGRVM